MMPTRCVSVSPNVTTRSGVDDRSMAAVHCPIVTKSSTARFSPGRKAARCQRGSEQQSLEHGGAGARDFAVKLQRVSRCNETADQDRNRHRAQKMLAREPGDQEAGQSVTDR